MIAGLDPGFENRAQRHSRFGLLGRQTVDLAIACVANDQPLVAVEHAQTMRHILDRRVKSQVLRLQLELPVAQFGGPVLHELIEPMIELFELADHQRDRAVGALAIGVRLLVRRGDERRRACRSISPEAFPALASCLARSLCTGVVRRLGNRRNRHGLVVQFADAGHAMR